MTYDCTDDIKKHIRTVQNYLQRFRSNLYMRGLAHDASKLQSPEKEAYDIMTPRLNELEYGTKEYSDSLAEFKHITDHHYANNSHHPEHWENGVDDMSLLDIVEMLADWKAASEKTKGGDIWKSLEVCVKRFGISPQLSSILINTVLEMGWNKE